MPENRPNWNALFDVGAAQAGYFTTRQAAEAGYSTQLLLKHQRAGRIVRAQRGIYRLVHFPPEEHEDLVRAWLWSDGKGVVSHESALALHGLSDALPGRIHLTLPASWRGRRLRVPPGILLDHADVPAADRAWVGPIPVTSPRRSLVDCARDAPPDLLQQAARQALRRGLVERTEIPEVEAALEPFGGLEA
jgi:predicted transcriptional regulator of viral defense system